MADLLYGKSIVLLTFELSSFKENGFIIFRAVATDTSRWTPRSARRQNTENRHTYTHIDTQTDTQDNYCNPQHVCTLRVNK